VAYRIAPDRVAEVKEYLDIREINGYTIHYTPFHPAPGVDAALLPQQQQQQQEGGRGGSASPFRTLVYIGTPDNDQFTGPQDPQALAEHIYRSAGPSGPNRDYLWGLERALHELSPESGDEHVRDLSERVRAIAARELARERERERKRERGLEEEERVVVGSGGGGDVGPEQVLQRELRHHEQRHEFRRAGSVDEQEETEKTS
jgi:cation transport regulator ChaC